MNHYTYGTISIDTTTGEKWHQSQMEISFSPEFSIGTIELELMSL